MITSNIIAKGILRALATLVLIALGLYFLFQIQSIIIYLVVALVLTLLGNPIQRFLKKRLKFNNIASTIVTLLLFIGGF
jgi:predicted PurR-regulated permease PerM